MAPHLNSENLTRRLAPLKLAERAIRNKLLKTAHHQKSIEAARRTLPWRKATGPRRQQGKHRASQNALKHGKRTAKAIAEERHRNAWFRLWWRTSLTSGPLMSGVKLRSLGKACPNGWKPARTPEPRKRLSL